MHFDQRTQRARRDVGLETDDRQAAAATVAEAVELMFGPTITDRVRFAPSHERLR
uniref:DUF7532 family protein n=1 Tax=Natronorubrum bangense TaxID=61858 RepID=UPI000A502992|nr:hypothetical protein [Natronorubrum bangense]